MQQMKRIFPTLCLILAMILWASSFIALKLAFEVYDPWVVIFGRMATAGLCFLFLIPKFKGNTFRKEDLKYFAFMVLCEPCLYFIFETYAVRNTTASQAGMVTAMLPLLVAVAASLVLHERVSRKTFAGFLTAIAGVFLLSVFSVPSDGAPNPGLGNFFECIAMVCAVGYNITLKKLTARYTPLFLTAVQAFAGSVFFLPFLFLPSVSLPAEFIPVPGFSIMYLGVFVTLGAYGLYNYGVSRMPASQASAFVNLIPVFTVLLGWMILDETFTPVQYLASALVILGVFLSQDKERGDL